MKHKHEYVSDGRSYYYCRKCYELEVKRMAKKHGAKQKTLQYLITDFAVEICPKVDKEKFNKAWHKLWCRIYRIGLFKDDTKINRSK